MYQKKPLAIAIALALGTLTLAGCSSGGGGGGTNDSGLHQPQNPTPEPTPTPSPDAPETEAPLDLEAVTVGVTDTGFDVAAIINNERVLSTTNTVNGSSEVGGGDIWHGTTMTNVITSDSLGNARVDLYQVSENGVTTSGALTYAKGFAAERGARVVNSSYANQESATPAGLVTNGRTAAESYDAIVNSNGGKGAVLVSGAGNEGADISNVGENALYNVRPDVWEMSLLAVGSDDGETLHPDSNFPGANQELQAHTIAAPYTRYDVGGQGTSLATAQISAYAAGIIGRWPHMQASEVVDLLLTTANRDSQLYSQNTCGESGNLNCGTFYLGQGFADIDAALQPQGELAVAVGSEVNGSSSAVSESVAQLSSAYGNSLAESGALDGIATFDALGRDYQVNLSGQAAPRTAYDKSLRDRMSRLSLTSGDLRQTERFDLGMFAMQSQYNGYGEVVASRFDGQLGKTGFTAFNYAGGEINPTSQYAESGMMPMLSYAGGNALTESFQDVSGFQTHYQVGDKLELTASHWIGNSDDTAAFGSDYQASRSDLGMDYSLTSDITLMSSFGVLNESNGLLGATGAGAMSLGDNNTMTFAGLGVDVSLNDSIKAFANYEQGFGKADTSGLISELNDIRTQEMAMGLQWSGKEQAAAFTIRQPMRLDSANAQLNVPVGRTIDGQVIRQARQADLSTSGRQVDFELGYTFKPSERSRMQFNLLHTLEPGHDASAPSDTAAMVNYTVQF